MRCAYDPKNGAEYAQTYALYFSLPESARLFFYDSKGNDCANFISQCVWAAYGGWVKGLDEKVLHTNRERMKIYMRQAPFNWYGSATFAGATNWCRVHDFFQYAVLQKELGPQAVKIAEGDWGTVAPSIIRVGDVIQMVVPSYMHDRYGHSVYVTQSGKSWDEITICCHSHDRLNVAMTGFSEIPDAYSKLRVMRFKDANFNK